MKYPDVRNYVAGAFVNADVALLDVHDPSSGDVIARVPLSTSREVDNAVRSARAAFPAWSATPIKERVQVFYRYKALLEAHIDELADDSLMTRRAHALPAPLAGRLRTRSGPIYLRPTRPCSPRSVRARLAVRSDQATPARHRLAPASSPRPCLQSP
jgi:hypothetical protein